MQTKWSNKLWARLLPFLFLLSFVAPMPQVAAQRDIGEQMEQEYGVVGTNTAEGRRLNEQLDTVVERIVRGVNRQYPNKNFQLRSAKILGGRSAQNDKVVNAFALPDGRIYVTLGLIRLLQDSPLGDDELAFVVGHEVTHVVERHSASQQRRSLPYILGAVLLGAVTNNQTLEQVIGLGAQAKISSFSRQDEYSADKGGLMAMHYAGFNLDGAPQMLRRLKGPGEQNKFLNGVFGSHPITENRIERVREMIQDVRSGRGIPNRSNKELERDDRAREKKRK